MAVLPLLVFAAACGGGSRGTVASSTSSTTGATATASPSGAGSSCARPGLPTTVAYRTVAGFDPDATSLDVHAPVGACGAPVVIWVHGGGYHTGDKANQMRDKVRLAGEHGWILVSVNYRLTRLRDPASAHFPDHYQDVAAAVAWVHDHIADYGGDPARIALLGHSAGADIVANVVTNPRYLGEHGLSLTTVSCAGPLDTEGFDKVAAVGGDPTGERLQWSDSLGNDSHYRTETSATRLVEPGIGIPETIGVVRGTPQRQRIERAYLAALDAAGIRTVTIDARGLSHNEVNTRIGAPGDTVMTPPLVSFLETCFTS